MEQYQKTNFSRGLATRLFTTIIFLILIASSTITCEASEKIKKGQKSPYSGRIFSEEETQMLMENLLELEHLREENSLLKEELVGTQDLVAQYKEWLALEQKKNENWAKQYDSLRIEYDLYKSSSRRKTLYWIAAIVVTGYGMSK